MSPEEKPKGFIAPIIRPSKIPFPDSAKEDPVARIEKAEEIDQERSSFGHTHSNMLDKIKPGRKTKGQVIKAYKTYLAKKKAIDSLLDINQEFEEADRIDRRLF